MNKNRYYDPFKMINSVVYDDGKRVCPNCKSRNEKIAQFCAHCGFNFLGKNSEPEIEIEETTLLKSSQPNIKRTAYLQLSNDVPKAITKTPFVLGKDKNNTDITLDSKVVSRVHAKIVLQGSDYYIIDNNSTNGSYVNGLKLTPNEKHRLNSQDKIRLANVDLNFFNE